MSETVEDDDDDDDGGVQRRAATKAGYTILVSGWNLSVVLCDSAIRSRPGQPSHEAIQVTKSVFVSIIFWENKTIETTTTTTTILLRRGSESLRVLILTGRRKKQKLLWSATEKFVRRRKTKEEEHRLSRVAGRLPASANSRRRLAQENRRRHISDL